MKKVLFLFLAIAIASCSANKQQENYTVSQPQNVQNNQKDADAINEFNKFANNNPLYFNFDSSKIEDISLIEKYRNEMNKLGKNVKYTITGMCDNRGSDDYNDKLGLKRASAVKQALGKNFNISTKSNGKRNFKKEYNNDEENYQANRKAVVIAEKVK